MKTRSKKLAVTSIYEGAAFNILSRRPGFALSLQQFGPPASAQGVRGRGLRLWVRRPPEGPRSLGPCCRCAALPEALGPTPGSGQSSGAPAAGALSPSPTPWTTALGNAGRRRPAPQLADQLTNNQKKRGGPPAKSACWFSAPSLQEKVNSVRIAVSRFMGCSRGAWLCRAARMPQAPPP